MFLFTISLVHHYGERPTRIIDNLWGLSMKVKTWGLGIQDSFSVKDIAESDRISMIIIWDSNLQKLKNQEKFINGNLETTVSRTTIYPYSIITKMPI